MNVVREVIRASAWRFIHQAKPSLRADLAERPGEVTLEPIHFALVFARYQHLALETRLGQVAEFGAQPGSGEVARKVVTAHLRKV